MFFQTEVVTLLVIIGLLHLRELSIYILIRLKKLRELVEHNKLVAKTYLRELGKELRCS